MRYSLLNTPPFTTWVLNDVLYRSACPSIARLVFALGHWRNQADEACGALTRSDMCIEFAETVIEYLKEESC